MKAMKMMKKAKAAKARVAAAQAKGQAAVAKVQSKVAQGQAAASKIQSKVSQAQSQVQSMKNQAIAAATIEPRIQPPPAPALEQPVIKSEPNVNMSVVQPYPSTAGMPMQQTLEAADPKMAAAVKKFKEGKIEMELGYPQILLTIILGVIYIAVTSLGIQTYNKCEGIQGSQKFTNLKHFMSHTMAVAITIPVVFLLTKFVKNEGGVFTILYSIMGIAGSAMAIQIMNQPECKDGVKKDEKNFAIVALVFWLILFLAGGYFTMKSDTVGGKALRAGAAGAATLGKQASAAGSKGMAAMARKMQ
tara:strand:- start:2687 stop:3595 length:909 start_codon:yes stop_codon:yes gene_type:complete